MMKEKSRSLLYLPILLSLVSILFSPAPALAEGEGPNDAASNEALNAAPNVDAGDAFCAPGIYSRAPELCPEYGPAADNAHIGSVQIPATVPQLKIT
ncbi:MAG: hypothetical protein HY260_17090, partial [Chloroflexi bacterium]|nr:hypothetical protein [Chloroflexota bacterium]